MFFDTCDFLVRRDFFEGSFFGRANASNRKRPTGKRLAFSLVELMVVIVIIGLLAGTATISVRSYLVRSKQNIAKTEISKICQALETFYAEFDHYPTTDEGLVVLSEPSDTFVEGLLSSLPNDPWGNPYEYLNPGRETAYEVVCYGADGREGGEGAEKDILSVELGDR